MFRANLFIILFAFLYFAGMNYLKGLLPVYMLCFIFIFGCKKEETLLSGNEAPEDPTVSNILRENYIHRVYLNLFGRQPDDAEKEDGLAILNKNNCSKSNRTELLLKIFADTAYHKQLYNIENTDMLGGLTQTDIKQDIIFYQQQLNDPDNLPDYYIILARLQKTTALYDLKDSMKYGFMDMVAAHRIISDSPSYESLTGSGSEWVTAIFLRFLFREPTEKELENCEEMLDDRSATLFLKEGNSKDDLVSIFFNSDEYFEGQVRTLYQRYLYREPEANIAIGLSSAYKISNDYQAIQKGILLTDEFLGIK